MKPKKKNPTPPSKKDIQAMIEKPKADEHKALTGADAVTSVKEAIEKLGIGEFAIVCVGQDGMVVPLVAASSIGNLLIMLRTLSKEADRLIDIASKQG